MPFLRLTRDRRGFKNTYLLHAAHPGDKPRLLYWYRTAPGVGLGRPPLDEDAIRTIEDQHPDIDFDWPAILALSEVMTPEEEDAPRPQARKKRRPEGGGRPPQSESRRQDVVPASDAEEAADVDAPMGAADDSGASRDEAEPAPVRTGGLLEELVGREIATRLRARHADIVARIREQAADAPNRDGWLRRANALDPDLWATPDAILDGVRNADALFDQLRAELATA